MDPVITEVAAAVGAIYAAVRTIFLLWRKWRNSL